MKNKWLYKRARFYRFIYLSYNKLREETTGFEKLIAIVLAFISIIKWLPQIKNWLSNHSQKPIDFNFWEWIRKDDNAIKIYLVVIVIFLVLLKLAKEFLIKTTEQFVEYLNSCFSFENGILRISDNDIKNFNRTDFCEQEGLRFATEGDIDPLLHLHKKAYFNTSWYAKDEEVRNRFQTNIQKNDHSILLLYDPAKVNGISNLPLGYVHVVPINNYTYFRYISGETKDIDISGSFIVSEKKSFIDDTPFALLIIALTFPEKTNIPRNQHNTFTGKRLIKALAFHLDTYLKREFCYFRKIPVVFQTLRPNIVQKFREFVTEKISKDHARIICIEIENTINRQSQKSINLSYAVLQKSIEERWKRIDEYIEKLKKLNPWLS